MVRFATVNFGQVADNACEAYIARCVTGGCTRHSERRVGTSCVILVLLVSARVFSCHALGHFVQRILPMLWGGADIFLCFH